MHSLLPFSLFIALVAAHARLQYPPPIDGPAGTDPSGNYYNSPLAADGSDFPCKNKHKSITSTTPVTTWAAGDGVGFALVPNGPGGGEGSMAAHSGGSCQASMSFDGGATWKALHSFQGGCPRGVPLNSNIAGPDQHFNFTLPANTRAGDGVFAWTWTAVTGNRNEFYMNCAAMKITGNGDSTLDDFPDMYVGDMTLPGQIPDGACRSTAGTALQYPNPGTALTVTTVQGIPFKLPSDGQCFIKGKGTSGGAASSGGAVYVPTSKGTGLPGTTSTTKSTSTTTPTVPTVVPTVAPTVPTVPVVPTTYPTSTIKDTYTTKTPAKTKPLTDTMRHTMSGPDCKTTFQTVVVPTSSSYGY